MPFQRPPRNREQPLGTSDGDRCNEFSALVDGGTGGAPGVIVPGHWRSATQALCGHTRSISATLSSGDTISPTVSSPMSLIGRRDSQMYYHDPGQTVIVFDWDDTLFPTTYVSDDLSLDWNLPLERQNLGAAEIADIRDRLALCEERAIAALKKAKELSHVVVVTLASAGWVDLSCKAFYPKVGQHLKEEAIAVIYAQEREETLQVAYNKVEFQADADVERYWGLVKGAAIADEASRFYSQYEGQSWKNILSIGDSCFERYGLLAASSAYMQGKMLANSSVWSPSQEGCWEIVQGGHVKKLRAKCCKLVDQPEPAELSLELEMVERWLENMVCLDHGFDLDLEALDSEDQVQVIESVLRGDMPVARLPKHVRLSD